MTVKELIHFLEDYPSNWPVKFMPDHNRGSNYNYTLLPFEEENILVSSEEAYVDDEADPETWDHEDGKIVDKGQPFLLINPIIT